MTHRKPVPPAAPPTLTLHAFKLTNQDTEILENLAKALSDRTGRASSRSAALRALIHVSEAFDGAMLERLADEIAREFQTGVRWGKDSVKPPR
jgi:hypothetical protein